MNQALFAEIVLLLLNVLWGYCFILIKQLLVEISPFYLLTLRFTLAALLLLPFQINNLRKISLLELKYFISCGFALAFGFILQTQGIRTTNPGKAGLITGTLVIFVPFLHFLWTRQRISLPVLSGTFITFVGLYFLSFQNSQDFLSIEIGDLYLLAGAVSYALHVVIVDRTLTLLKRTKPILLAQVQLFTVGILSFIPALYDNTKIETMSNFVIFGILFLSIFGSLLAYILQMWAQKFSYPPRMGVILSTEAVFACIFSYYIFGEVFTLSMWIGAILVLTGILITQEVWLIGKKNVTKH